MHDTLGLPDNPGNLLEVDLSGANVTGANLRNADLTDARLIGADLSLARLEGSILAGADLYVSGEISEQTVHLARDSGVPSIAAGHHAMVKMSDRSGHLARRLIEHFPRYLPIE
mgnify:CR=1 FL=1